MVTTKNKLSLNAAKTELIIFRSNRHPINYSDISIKFNGHKLTPVSQVKYLGMYIDEHLSWDCHVAELAKKLSRANGVLSKLRYNAPLHVCLQVYYSLFYSHLIYGCNVWGLTSEENIEKIEVLQRKCVRILTFAPFNAHTNQIFIDLKILKVRDVIKLNQLKLTYDFLNNNLPADLMPLFQRSSDVRSVQTNSVVRDLLYLPSFQSSTYGNRSIRYRCAQLWNEMFKSGSVQVKSDREKHSRILLSKIRSGYNLRNALKRHFLYFYTVDQEFVYY